MILDYRSQTRELARHTTPRRPFHWSDLVKRILFTELSKSPSNSSRRLVTIQRQENPAGIIVHGSSAEGFESMYHRDSGGRERDDGLTAQPSPRDTVVVEIQLPPPPTELPGEAIDSSSLQSGYSSQINMYEEQSSTDDNASMPSSVVVPIPRPDTSPSNPHSEV